MLNKFGELFIKTNRIDARYSSMLRKAFDFRQSYDYDIEVTISDGDAKLLVSYASEFYELSEYYLESLIKSA